MRNLKKLAALVTAAVLSLSISIPAFAAVEGTGSARATETGLTFAVESGAGEVYLCTAALTEDGTVIPSRDRTLSADELGAVTVSRPGLYALCTGDIASPSATVLINATGSGPADAVVKL